MQLSPASPYPVQYNLSNGANEPINFIATFQANACLVACRASGWTIEQGFFKATSKEVTASRLAAIAKGSEYLAANPSRASIPVGSQPNWPYCLIRPQGAQLVFEFGQAYELETALALRNGVKDFIFQKYGQVQQANREITETCDSPKAYRYSISSDLRASLRTIGGYADLLKENYGEVLDEDGQHLLETIQDNSAKLTDLISGLLAYTHAGKAARQQGRATELQISDDLPTAVADKPALVTLIKNLLSNAFKYSANSNPSITETGGSKAHRAVQFCIMDNGIGFDMHHGGRIFGVFNRLVNDEQFEGTGIGLAIVKRTVGKRTTAASRQSAYPPRGRLFPCACH